MFINILLLHLCFALLLLTLIGDVNILLYPDPVCDSSVVIFCIDYLLKDSPALAPIFKSPMPNAPKKG